MPLWASWNGLPARLQTKAVVACSHSLGALQCDAVLGQLPVCGQEGLLPRLQAGLPLLTLSSHLQVSYMFRHQGEMAPSPQDLPSAAICMGRSVTFNSTRQQKRATSPSADSRKGF